MFHENLLNMFFWDFEKETDNENYVYITVYRTLLLFCLIFVFVCLFVGWFFNTMYLELGTPLLER